MQERRGQGFPFCQRGWKTFVVGPPGRLGEGCVHPRLAGFAYPTNDVVQTSHAGKKKSLFGVKYKIVKNIFLQRTFENRESIVFGLAAGM